MIRHPLFLLTTLFAGLLSGTARSAASPKVVSLADFGGRGSFTAGIQEAIDALPAEGGVVEIPPGTYVIRRSIALRSHLTLRGAGSTTVITRGKQAITELLRPTKKGDTVIGVLSAEDFRPGGEIFLRDDLLGGWHGAHCVVKRVEPGRVVLAEPLWTGHDEGVFRPERGALLSNDFPLIRANRFHWDRPLRDVAVTDLVLDGNPGANPIPGDDFTLAAIHFANVQGGLVRNVTVRGSAADGFGIQGGRNVRVLDCLAERCRSHGFHPGTSLRDAIFANNTGRHNGGDGLYFCADVVGVSVTGNLLHDNAGNGIGGLGDRPGGDRFNIVSNNICRVNGRHGIHSTGGADNLITANVCLGNSRSKPGVFSGIALQNAIRYSVTGNICSGGDGGKPTQKYGIEEIGEADGNAITGNQCRGNFRGGIRILGQKTRLAANVADAKR